MRASGLLGVVLLMHACRREAPVAPMRVERAGALRAMACPGVVAVFSGSAEALPPGAPANFAVESLAFEFASGAKVGFVPKGQLFFSDWTFDVFSPDCQHVALQVDHYGPVEVHATAALEAGLKGQGAPLVVTVPKSRGEAPVIGQVSWQAPRQLEVVASSNGGAQVYRATLGESVALERVFFAPSAPSGVRRTTAGYEVVQ